MRAAKRESGLKRTPRPRVRKNAVKKAEITVVPLGGTEKLKSAIGEPFEPLDFRDIVARARRKTPGRSDRAFQSIVGEITRRQLNSLLKGMGIKRTDPVGFQKAFVTLAFALLGVGQVAWRPRSPSKRRPTLDDYARLYWSVKRLIKGGEKSERRAIEALASENVEVFPYRPHQDTKISPGTGRSAALWQAYMKAKRRETAILSRGEPKAFEGVFGERMGRWEMLLVALDIKDARSKSGKKSSR